VKRRWAVQSRHFYWVLLARLRTKLGYTWTWAFRPVATSFFFLFIHLKRNDIEDDEAPPSGKECTDRAEGQKQSYEKTYVRS